MNVATQEAQIEKPQASMSIARLTWINVSKDLRLEWRSRDVFNSMMFFALVVVVVFSFSFEREDSRPVMGGLIWIAFLFSTTMALNQSWARELRNGVLDAYRVSPAPAEALFLGKCLGNFILVMLLECLMAPLFVVFYNLSYGGPSVAAAADSHFRHVGAGGERNVFCRHVHSHAQPRAHAALASAANFAPGSDQHGRGHYSGTERRGFARGTVAIPGRILRDLYHGMFPAV